MATALHTTGLPSRPHQGVGARLVRRLGGAVRNAIVGGIALAGALRRPAALQTSRDHAATQHPEAPLPRPLPLPRRPRAALSAPLPPPPWLAHLLARRHRRSAAASRPAFLNQGDVRFTPEAFPQLTPKACAVLNTPLKDCDPKTLELVVSTFTQYINQVMSPEAGISDRAATLPNLWHRLSTALAETEADTSRPATPGPVPATPADEVPDAPASSPHPPIPPTGPTRLWTNDAPRLSPLPLSAPPASDPPAEATVTAAAPKIPPDIAAPSGPVVHRSRPFRYSTQSFARWRRSHIRSCRQLFPRGVPDGLQCLPPPWRLYYAACTGPP